MKISSILKNRVVNNAKWMVGEQLIQMIISFVISMITARYLGPSNYGIINYCAAYVAFFTSICSLGLEGVLVNELVTKPEKEGEFVGTALAMRVLSSLFSIISISIILLIVDKGNTTVMTVGFLQSLVLLFKAFEVLDFWFQSKLQSKYVAIVKIISYILVAVYKVYILATKKPVQWFAFSTSLDFLIIAVLLVFVYKGKKGPKIKVKFSLAKYLLKNSYHFIISGLFVTVYMQIDRILIQKFLGDAQVGYYSIATNIFSYWTLVTTAIINAARPSIMVKRKDNYNEYIKRLKQLYAVLIWLSFAAAIFFTVFGNFVIPLLYGAEYKASVPLTAITMWYSAFSVLGTARGIWLVCESKASYVKYFMLMGAVTSITLNLILIPRLGAVGAAITSFITQLVTSVIAPLFFKETRVHTRYIFEAMFFKGIR